MSREKTIARLESFRTLDKYWLDEVPRHITDAAVDKAKQIVLAIEEGEPLPKVYPAQSCGVSLEWGHGGEVMVDEYGELDILFPEDTDDSFIDLMNKIMFMCG